MRCYNAMITLVHKTRLPERCAVTQGMVEDMQSRGSNQICTVLLGAAFALLASAASPARSAEAALLAPDLALRDGLLRARDTGRLAAPVMMWPVTAATARAGGIGAAPCAARVTLMAQASDAERLLLGFGDGASAERRASARACTTLGTDAVATLTLNAEDTAEERRVHLDGSYAGVVWRGVLASAGVVPRFWGPGWAGSLILGDNARPVPAVSLRRADASRPFESPWLSWLGPWDAEVFFGQLQGHTQPRQPRFSGLRAEAAPTPWLTLGASRAIQWGGRGRDNSLRSLWDALLGQDNTGTDNEPGNQLAGFDVRASLAPLGVPVAVYTQWIGEDEAGYLPAKYIALHGAEAWFETGRWRWRAVLEHVDTVAGVHDEHPGTAYRHFIFRQGYTQDGRVLGFSLGTDVRAIVAQLHGFGSGPWSGSVRALAGRANPGGLTNLPYAADSSVRGAELRVRYMVGDRAALEARVGRSAYTPMARAAVRETSGSVTLELRLP